MFGRLSAKQSPCMLGSMACRDVGFEVSFARNAGQDLSRHHGGVKSGRAEAAATAAGSASAAANGCKLSLLSFVLLFWVDAV